MATRFLRLRDEHDAVQRKTFTKWINARFTKAGKPLIKDMFADLRDGRKLLDLLEGLTGSVLTKERGSTRVHALNNVNKVLQVLHQNNVELVNIGGTDIVDGNHKLTLGLIWSIILHWQVKDVMKDIMSHLHQTNSEKILLSWVRQSTRPYNQVNVLNFTTSWTDGLAFNAIIHKFKPCLFSWEKVLKLSPVERLEHAFNLAKQHLVIERLLDPEDVAVPLPDKKSIIMYVTSFFEVLPKEVTMDDIREVETLPRRYKVECEENQFNSQQSTASEEETSSSRAETPSTVTEMEVDLDSYQATLEEVLTWLLSAEDTLQMQENISNDVEDVKDQFHTHEVHLADQIPFIKLHEVLMELQQQQLQELSDWLTETEARIHKIELEPFADDVEAYEKQMEQHKDKSGQVQKWMDGVESFLTKENVALGDAEKLREEMEQCTMFVNEMENMEVALKRMKDCEAALKQKSFPGLAGWGQPRLANYQTRWEKLAKQILSHHGQISENQEKAENLRKDLTEMQEWMSQADEEYLMRDFEYKTPEELEGALEEMNRAKEDVLQKEVKVKIMKDSMNMLVAKSPPGGQDLTLNLAVVLKNYQKLCDRFRSKCHTLEEVWSCWIELIQYLDMETNWLNNLEEQVQNTENLLDSTEAVNEALESLESVLRHPADNRTQIRELGQTLIDGGILDEIISEKLEAFNTRYEELSHQILSHHDRISENQEKAENLRKDLTEMQEWMSQADEEYLMRDFEYKTPEELEGALEEMNRAKEDVLQKEVKVKIMKDSMNMLVAKSPPGGQDLTLNLAVVLKNYQKLCDRFRSKCHTLEEVWSCWIELIQYLDMETNWLNNLEEQVQNTENLLDSTEAVNEALESLESVLRHPADNRTQIRELGQTLIDGGILDEIISEKLEAFNTRYEELSHQAVSRQISLEQHLQCLRENDQLLQALQESLTQLDQELTSYLTDRIDAFQLPQEAQTIQAEIAAHEVSLEELRRRNAGNFPPVTPEGKSPRGGTLLDVLQVTEGKQDLEKALQISQKLQVETTSLQQWLAATETILNQKNASENMPADVDGEVVWAKGVLKELERRKAGLSSITESSAALQGLVEGSEAGLEERLCVLNAGWGRVRTWTEDWLSHVLKHQNEMEIFDENLAHISTWLYQTEICLDETEKHSPSQKGEVVKNLLSELDDVSLRVDSVRDQAVILMTSRGSASREVVEPKLAELNRNFEKVSHHIKAAKMSVGTEPLTYEVSVRQEGQKMEKAPSGDLHLFDKDLQNLLKNLDKQLESPKQLPQDDDKVDEEKAVIEEMLQRGEQMLQQTSGDGKSEEIRKKLLILQTKYSTLRELKLIQKKQTVELTPGFSQFKREKDSLLNWMDETENRLSGLHGVEDDQKLQELLQELELRKEEFSALQKKGQNLSQYESVEVNSEQVDRRWQEIESQFLLFQQTHFKSSHVPVGYEAVDGPSLFASDFLLEVNKVLLAMADIELLLNSPELSSGIYKDFSSQEDALKYIKNMLEKLGEQVAVIHEKQPDVILEASRPEVVQIEDGLTQLNSEWDTVNRMYNDRKGCFDKSVEEWRQFHCDLSDLTQWVTEAEQLLADGNGPDGVLDLDKAKMQQQALANEMNSKNEKLNWLNTNGPQILSSRGMNLQERDKHVTKLRAVNMNWSKVSRELLDMVGEVEVNLQNQSQFQDKMNQLAVWVSVKQQKLSGRGPSQMSASELQMLETTMKESKTEMEDLLARSVDLQKRQQLLPQEKSKVEQLAADWKTLDLLVKEVVQQPVVSCTQQVTQQRVTVPSAVQMASLVTSEATHQTMQSPDLVAPTDLNETATELADWLVLIDQMLKSNIVTVGDVDEIKATIGLLKRTKADLEQRHPQLEDIFTLAQNIKNKTSNVDVRTFITEKLERVRNQWDSTQHGVETRLQQFEEMVTDSNQWEERRREVEMLIGQNEVHLHNLQQLSKEPLTKQLADYKMFLQDLNKGQITVKAFNDVSGKLLCDYPNDDTRRVKETTDRNNMAWNTINNRASDRQSLLDSDIKMLQTSLKEMEGFLKWLQEAETTGNVLADASQRESLTQDSVRVIELRNQLEG
ncbi:UNVERIFIED_CONTAM: hypothetical protein FKN15_062821 [Acipenser sinensis]